MHCQVCSIGIPEPLNEHVVRCPECGGMEFTYMPQDYQAAFHNDDHKYKGFFGGYGSGKTTTAVMEVIKHVLSTPNGLTLMGAATFPQLEQTSMKEFFDRMPKQLIKHHSKQKNYVDMHNGHRVIFRPLDDEGKARSLNLTCFHIEEASEVKQEYFEQLKTRLRNTAAVEFETDEDGNQLRDDDGSLIVKRDWRRGILSSNPDVGWIRTEFLLTSDAIYGVKPGHYYIEPDRHNRDISSHIAATELNKYLPPTFEDEISMNKPEWWIKRYLKGSFDYSEGMVYPKFAQNVVEDFKIPPHWERMLGVDFGRRDPTVMLAIAINPEDGTCYIYDEYYQNERDASEHSKRMKEIMAKIPDGRLRMAPVADPNGQNRSIDGRSYFDHYAEHGVYFTPGQNAIEAGVFKVFTYFEMDKIKIFKSCTNTVSEGINYKYKPAELGSDKNLEEKPIDYKNHAMDALRYVIMELPDNPKDLINKSYTRYGTVYGETTVDPYVNYAFADEPEEQSSDDWYHNF